MPETCNPIAIDGLEVREAGVDVIVHDPQHEQVHILNRTAGAILELCDGAHAPEEIAASLCARTGAPRDRVLPDVNATLETFRQLRFVR